MKHVCYFRHALALDERRVKFLPEYTYGEATQPVQRATIRGETMGNHDIPDYQDARGNDQRTRLLPTGNLGM